MGIPSYFSYIIQNHPTVLKKYAHMIQNNIRFARLYLDCNSILYDCYRQIPSHYTLLQLEDELLKLTVLQIENYVNQLKPFELIYIAFDGVAPIAKMEQQRNRRYKSWFETAMLNKIEGRDTIDITKTTSMFTPGTKFMEKLSIFIRKYFEKKNKKYQTKTIIVATPDEPGEGEHKLFAHMRENPTNESCAVYGLDADLLMLGICNLNYCPSMFIFRESPQFAKTILEKTTFDVVSEDEPLFIDMGVLSRSISSDMQCSAPDNHRMLDYVFLCFFLGNDFLPHFPSLNIRTNGIHILLDAYKNIIGNKQDCFLLSKTYQTGIKIQWKQLYKLLLELSKNERNLWKQEYGLRSKWDKKPVMLHQKGTPKEKTELFQNTPVLYRKEEKYINPYQHCWEERYYQVLFSKNVCKENIISNYLEGIEWVSNYYFSGKVDWSWKYKFHYPPLLKDMIPKISTIKTTILPKRETKPVPPLVQLAYVLPPIYRHLLPTTIDSTILDKQIGMPLHSNGLPNIEFQWAFCRYFWECHVKLPEIELY